ncbi:MAG TPA: acyltransferase [Prosthecobacter sp.]
MNPRAAYISFLDPLRGFAILIVFAYHCLGAAFGQDHLPWSGWLRSLEVSWDFLALSFLSFGRLGVAVFFVISGFCIHLSHKQSSEGGLSRFYTRRFFRIYPPYLVALLVFALLPPWKMVNLGSAYGRADFASHVLLLHNLDDRSFYGINPSFWSIATEAQLYLVYPLLFGLASRLGWGKVLYVTGAVEVALRLAVGWADTTGGTLPPTWIVESPLGYACTWALGAAAADAWLHARPLPLSRVPLWLFPLLTVGLYAVRPLAQLTFLSVALSTLCFIRAGLAAERAAPAAPRSLLTRHLAWTGVISYSVYLLHQPLLSLVERALAAGWPELVLPPLVLFFLGLALWLPVLGAAAVFHKWVELPSIALGKKLLRRRQSGLQTGLSTECRTVADSKP